MSSYSKVILLGRVGKTPEVKAFDSGAKVVRFSLATSSKSKKGEEVTQWHSCEVWNEGTRKFIESMWTRGISCCARVPLSTEGTRTMMATTMTTPILWCTRFRS